MRYIFFILLQIALFASDFDVIVVGTSPVSLFEALYQHHSGKKVLILEESDSCGGAWKSINICGISNVDLGCHTIGYDLRLKSFLEEYAGCTIVSHDNPLDSFDQTMGEHGYYFSKGCSELIDNLLKLISATDIILLSETKLESLVIDSEEETATVTTKRGSFSTDTLIVTPMSDINFTPSSPNQCHKIQHRHLYLLIQDPTPPKFSYYGRIGQSSSRVMNLTHFTGLFGTGLQLIAIQVRSEEDLTKDQVLFDALQTKGLVDECAILLKSEPYTYETGSFNQGYISQLGGQNVIRVLQSSQFYRMAKYISKWTKVLKPYDEALLQAETDS